MKRFLKSKKGIALLATIAVAALASGAFAYFTTTGSSNGSGSVGTAANGWTVAADSFGGSTNLYPGVGEQTLTGTVTNNTGGNANLAEVTATIAAPTIATGAPTGDLAHPCSAADFKLDASTGWVVALDGQSATYAIGQDLATGHSASWTALGISMPDASYDQDNCQGATPNITFAAS